MPLSPADDNIKIEEKEENFGSSDSDIERE
jgi:hypothetical protein